jgi:hypothetical protein
VEGLLPFSRVACYPHISLEPTKRKGPREGVGRKRRRGEGRQERLRGSVNGGTATSRSFLTMDLLLTGTGSHYQSLENLSQCQHLVA